MVAMILASRFLKPVLLVLGVVLALTWAYGSGRDAGIEKMAAKYDRDLKAAQLKERELVASYRVRERAAVEQLAQIGNEHQEAMADAKAEADRVLESVRGGTIRVRDKLKCPATNGRVSHIASSAGSSDAGEGSGLSQADAELVLRIAAEADQVVHQLKACQAVVRADRQL